MNLLSKEQIPSKLRVPEKGRLLIAFSGGSDSLALMYILSSLAPERCEALYVNHRIRTSLELEKELKLNEKNANSLGIKLNVVSLESGEVEEYARLNKCGIEASCRALRYKELNEYATQNNFDYILTAHHLLDQAETVLMRILEHSPFYTYQGILFQDGAIIRPMLEVSKDEIERIIKLSGLEYSTDSTNSDTRYKRNFIRHRIIPLLSKDSLYTLSNIALNLQEYIKKRDNIDIHLSRHYVDISRNSFLSSDIISRENAIYRASNHLENKERLSRAFLEHVYSIVKKGQGKASTKYLDFIAMKEKLRVFSHVADFSSPFSFSQRSINNFDIRYENIDSKVLNIDTSLLKGNVVLRKSRSGDEIILHEGTKRVRELETRAHVPYSLVLEDENGIIAVFLRFLGANDRLSRKFISHYGTPIIIL